MVPENHVSVIAHQSTSCSIIGASTLSWLLFACHNTSLRRYISGHSPVFWEMERINHQRIANVACFHGCYLHIHMYNGRSYILIFCYTQEKEFQSKAYP